MTDGQAHRPAGSASLSQLAVLLMIATVSFMAGSPRVVVAAGDPVPSVLPGPAQEVGDDLLRLMPTQVRGHDLDVTVLGAEELVRVGGFAEYLERVGGDPDAVASVVGTDEGSPWIRITLTGVPGVDAGTLLLTRLATSTFQPRLADLGGRQVVAVALPDGGTAYLYAIDGVLVEVWASDPELAEGAIELLPEPDRSASIGSGPRLGAIVLPPLFPRSLDLTPISLSPDGRWILATASMLSDTAPDGLARVLCVLDVSTLIARSCADWPSDEPPPWLFEDIAWAPDGQRLALATMAIGTDGDLWLLDVESGLLSNIADDGYAGPVDTEQVPLDGMDGVTLPGTPTFSPDGRSVTYAVIEAMGGRWKHRIMDRSLTGEDPLVLVDDTEEVLDARWSDDGSRLFYRTRSDGIRKASNIWVYDPVGSTTRLVFEGREAEWDLIDTMLPIESGSRIILRPFIRPPDVVSFWVLDVETGEVSRLPGDGGEEGPIVNVTLSPDGTSVLTRRAGGALAVRRLDGRLSAVEVFPPLADLNGAPQWASNNTVLFQTKTGALLLVIEPVDP